MAALVTLGRHRHAHERNALTALVEAVGRRQAGSPLARDVMLVIAGSVVVAGMAQISVRLPFTPVPITGQTLAVLLVGASMGAVRGVVSLLLYLVEGAAGLPVFAEGKSGLLYLASADPLHTTGGYLWGFVVAAFVVGWLAQRGWDRGVGSAIGALVLGEIAIFSLGVPWLAAAINVSADRALELGLYPFVLGEVLKILVAAGILPGAWRLVRARR
jgi:biotin transport system substrate-specific component